MDTRNVEFLLQPPPAHYVGDGFRVHNFIPSYQQLTMERMNPFILLDYNSKFYFSPKTQSRGVGVHPHRGFETVTIAYKGSVAHHDSSGGGGVIAEGDVQWMTAASGILHKEYHEEAYSKAGGDFQMIQLWVNLPAKDKMGKPQYQAVKNSDIKRYAIDNKGSAVEVIAGAYKGVQGTATTFSPIQMYNLRLKKDAAIDFSFPSSYHTCLLVVEGSVSINDGTIIPLDNLAVFEDKGESFVVKGLEDALCLVLSGAPLNEPIAAHGPFVMNTKEEIMQAYQDFQEGKFGYLEN